MSAGIEFYHNPMSRSRIVHWALEECGAHYHEIILDFASGEHKRPEFLKINPMGKLPAIVDRGVTITETAAICAYLADAYPAAGLAPPPGEAERGRYYRWMFFAASCFEAAFTDKMFQRPEVENKAALGYGSYEAVLAALEGALQPGPYILGDRFSMADVYLGSQLAFGQQFGGPGLRESESFTGYVARLKERPAYRRAADADDAMVASAQSA